ncbi:hypothetical protein DFQ30_001767 [Apophysomyces sp. BC1015]|nr:hypothetical protein DFQ30_001767 [Apophysomyces sp. BC1015]
MDNAAAKLGAAATVFPKSRQMLCTMHIRGNFKRKCCVGFDEEEQHVALLEAVDKIFYSSSMEAFELAKQEFIEIAQFSRKTDAIVEYLELELVHFGATTTQRVEGAHDVIKDALKSSGSLRNAIQTIDTCIRYESNVTEYQKEKEKLGRDPYLSKDDEEFLHPLLGKVSRYAIDTINQELPRVTEESKLNQNCNCSIRKNFNLPCRHLLPYKSAIPLSLIANRWLLDVTLFHEATELTIGHREKPENSLIEKAKEKLYAFKKTLVDGDDQQREILLSQLTDLVSKNSPPSLAELKEPEQIVQKGRPKSTKRKLTAVEILDKKVAEEKKKQVKRQKLSQNTSSEKAAVPRIRLIVKYPSERLEEKALAKCILQDENQWKMVKLALCSRLHTNLALMSAFSLFTRVLVSGTGSCTLAADAFNTPVAVYTGQGKDVLMFLPVGLPLRPSAKPIVLQFVNGNHIVLIDLKADTTKFL